MTIHHISLSLLSTLLISLLTACSSDEPDAANHATPIKFASPSLTAASRATPVTNATITDFGVFAALNPDSLDSSSTLTADYMYDVQATSATSWSPVGEYYWPGSRTPLRFNAYSPYRAKGITAMPDRSLPGSPSIVFTVPANPQEQPDLLRATPVNASQSPCALTFNHALAAVTFTAGDALSPCTVSSITLSRIPSTATLNLETGLWSDISAPATFTIDTDVTLTAAEGSPYVTPSTAISPSEATLMLIPQTLPADATLTVEFTPAGGDATTKSISIAGLSLTAGLTTDIRLSF